MNGGMAACYRLEVYRGRRALVGGLIAALVIALLNAVHDLASDNPVTILLLVLPGMYGLFSGMHPYATLMGDRMAGRLALERALPQPWWQTAAARLAGAATRTLVTPAFAAAVLVGVTRHSEFQPGLVVGLGLVASAWFAVTAVCWTLMALNARWSLIRLWWVPTTIWFAPQFVPESWIAAALRVGQPLWEWFLGTLSSPAAALALVSLLLALAGVVAAGATLIYASGLRHFEHDPDPFGLVGKRDRVVRVLEYPIGQRTLIPAVALLDIRLGVERLAKQGIIIVGIVIVAVIGPEALREMAPTYLLIMGAMVPGAVAIGILSGRQSGALASLQQLPHPRWHVGIGKLLAVVALAAVGAGVMMLGRILDDGTEAVGVATYGRSVTLLAGGAWMGAVIAMWWKREHLRWLVPLAVVLGVVLFNLEAGLLDLVRFGMRHAALATAGVILVALAGVPLFAHGLARYQKR